MWLVMTCEAITINGRNVISKLIFRSSFISYLRLLLSNHKGKKWTQRQRGITTQVSSLVWGLSKVALITSKRWKVMYILPEVFCFIFSPKEINAMLQNRQNTLIREIFPQHTCEFYNSKQHNDKEESFV